MARLLAPAVFGLAAVQVMVFLNTLLASLPAGRLDILPLLRRRVMEFPLGVFGIALGLGGAARDVAPGGRRRHARPGGDAELRAPAGRLHLHPGHHRPPRAARADHARAVRARRFHVRRHRGHGEALSGYAVGLVAFAAARITAQAFYAVGRPGVAVRLGILAVAANVLAALALMRPARSRRTRVRVVDRRLRESDDAALGGAAAFGRLGGRALLASSLRTAAASGAARRVLLARAADPRRSPRTRGGRHAVCSPPIAIGALVFWLASAALGSSSAGRSAGCSARAARRSAPLEFASRAGRRAIVRRCTPTPPTSLTRNPVPAPPPTA